MRYQNVYLESFGYDLPDEVLSSAEIERRLDPLYQRLGLPEGRLELMTGVRERRLWARFTLPSEKSALSATRAIEAAEMDRCHIGALVHGSVCRDFLEPATACRVHHALGLRGACLVYDVSNACLGLLNAIVHVANMIELGQIRAGLIVGTEGCRELVETTIDALNRDESLTRADVKRSIASLTIGSASAAVLLCDARLTRTGNRLLAACARADTTNHELCRGSRDEAVGAGMQPLMSTESEQLMHAGINAGVETFGDFLNEAGWSREQVHKTFCHQVGAAHRKLMLKSLELDLNIDYSTVQWLGNTGSVALPITMALGIDDCHLASGDHVAMLGIGSGINCLMLAVDWQGTVASCRPATPHRKRAEVC